MPLETRSPAVLRFGTFEVDLCAGELRKQGVRIKLQEQPFHVLTALLLHPGKVVTREELRAQLWSAETFVDFDNSLNTSINKLRETLSDSAESPHFIETLPRRGYRFIAPVSSSNRKVPTQAWKIVVAVVAVAALVASGLFWRSRQARRLTEKDTIVLGDFTNSTGDPVFDGALREGLSVQLEQSPFLSLVSHEGIQQTLHMMGQPSNARLTPEISREVCQRTHSAAALDGSIALIGTRYNLILKAASCINGDLLASTEAQANDKSHVLDALGTVASEIRTKLGESLSTVQKYNTPLEQATTPSLEALQAYSLGFRATWVAGENDAALPFLQRATQFDPNFAMAYWAMSNAYSGNGESTLAAKTIRKAFELRAGASELEKLLIETDYSSFQTGDLMKLRLNAEVGAQTFPREAIFHLDLGVVANYLGQYEAGLKEHREALRLAPYNSLFTREIVYTSLLLNRVDEAAATAAEAHAKGRDSSLGPIRYLIAFYRNDPAEMTSQVKSASGKPGEEDLLLALEGDTAAYSGHLSRAREFSRRAAESAEQAGENETAATFCFCFTRCLVR